MADPLEGVGWVPWSSLKCTYGDAREVPRNLELLLSADAKLRERAWCYFYGDIMHQGCVYPAAIHVVPFLIRLAAAPATPERHQILEYLHDVAQSPDYEVQGRIGLLAPSWFETRSHKLLTQAFAVLRRWRGLPPLTDDKPTIPELCSARLDEGVALLEALLEDEDVLVRRGAARLLGHCPAAQCERLEERIESEPDDAARGLALLSLSQRDVARARPYVADFLTSAEGNLTHLCAALLTPHYPEMRQEAQATLLHLLSVPALETSPLISPECHIYYPIVEALAALDCDHPEAVAELLFEGRVPVMAAAIMALDLVFPRGDVAELTPLQHKVLETVAQGAWGEHGTYVNLVDVLRERGLEAVAHRLVKPKA